MDNRNSKIYTEISDIEVSQVVIVLFFSTEISIEVLRWIIAILNFSTEMSDIEHSRVILVIEFSIEISTEILTWIIRTLNFSTEISDIQSSRVIVVRFSILNINVDNHNTKF